MEDRIDIARTIENESIRRELEMFNSHLGSELIDKCRHHILDNKICRKYGIQRKGLLAAVLAKFIEVQKDDEFYKWNR